MHETIATVLLIPGDHWSLLLLVVAAAGPLCVGVCGDVMVVLILLSGTPSGRGEVVLSPASRVGMVGTALGVPLQVGLISGRLKATGGMVPAWLKGARDPTITAIGRCVFLVAATFPSWYKMVCGGG